MKGVSLPKMKRPPAIDFAAVIDDFKRLNPQDVGTWPLIPRITVLVAVFVAIVVLGWWFVWNDQLANLENKRQQEEKQKQEYLEKKKKAVNLDLHKQQLSEIDKTFGALLKQLPSKSEMEALLTEINQAGLGRGLQFESFIPGQEATKDFYAELPITLKLTGSYDDFGTFSSDIAKLSRIVTLNNLVITPQTSGKLTLDATAKTFRYLDEEELAKAGKQKKPAKPGDKK